MTQLPVLRRARPEDAASIAEAQRIIAAVPGRLASTPGEIQDEAIRALIVGLNEGGRGLFIVAELEGQIVGHGLLERLGLSATSHVVRLTLAVHEGHQGLGLGRALMNELLRWARASQSVEKVELQVRSGNERAIGLYRSLGFIEEGRKTMRLKLGPGQYLDDIYMALWVGR